ncbi:MAG: polyprenyl synthetase family protein [Bacteroidaceae bacterium]|jgi:octaprenyl-diphosphate synthase|nr:polyprenyl synthetase family protein [Bacteroidaceae bacterium]
MTDLQQIQAPIATELARFNELLEATLQHDNPLLHTALVHILRRKGKQMRPTMVLLAARAAGEVTPEVYHAALSLELLHTASLVHDDVVDESDRRRGQESVNALLDNQAAVLVGDYILSKSLQHAAATQDPRVVTVVAELGQTLADGELLQMHGSDATDVNEALYYEIIRKKTASLFSACGQLGALTAGGTEGDVERLRQYGQLTGMCFQLRDDLFDLTEGVDVGKPVGNDLREGKLTLPLIYALRHCPDEQMLSAAQRVRHGEATQEDIDRLTHHAIDQGGIQYAQWSMNELRMMAVGLVQETPDPAVSAALRSYVDFVVERNS